MDSPTEFVVKQEIISTESDLEENTYYVKLTLPEKVAMSVEIQRLRKSNGHKATL
jgi:hypothetical protein